MYLFCLAITLLFFLVVLWIYDIICFCPLQCCAMLRLDLDSRLLYLYWPCIRRYMESPWCIRVFSPPSRFCCLMTLDFCFVFLRLCCAI
ncbi:uncharacterized protein BDV14DRAFT_87038 [Aspergillus stella-maris]|uniref:uncharacterized protein n=1 Tax=Aspergillus stella-maris TaxID=1810926 RepID=UPI003CCDD4C5